MKYELFIICHLDGLYFLGSTVNRNMEVNYEMVPLEVFTLKSKTNLGGFF